MPVLLDSKDMMAVDREFAAESCVWAVLAEGVKSVSAEDFVGANEVRINKMSGFCASDYLRGGDNARAKIDVSKETRKLEYERWMGYDLDALDESENSSYSALAVVEEHTRNVAIPEKDAVAVRRLLEHSEKMVAEAITSANALEAFDAAEQYMTDGEIVGPFVMLCSSDYYRALKNSEGASHTLLANVTSVAGVDRRVGMMDNDIPIVRVPAARLQQDANKKVNFIFVPLRVAAPIEKYNDVMLVPAASDREGYRDTVKGLNYYDLIVFDNAGKAIYVSYEEV